MGGGGSGTLLVGGDSSGWSQEVREGETLLLGHWNCAPCAR